MKGKLRISSLPFIFFCISVYSKYNSNKNKISPQANITRLQLFFLPLQPSNKKWMSLRLIPLNFDHHGLYNNKTSYYC